MSAIEAQPLDANSELQRVFEAQRRAYAAHPYPELNERKRHLTALLDAVLARRDDMVAAIHDDFGSRSRYETLVGEVMVVADGLRYARKHLKRWMRADSRHVSLTFQPGRAKVLHQPLGVVGIVSPWNYPVQLALSPLTAALAAGNRVMLKPSELTPATSALLRTMIAGIFPEDQVAVVEGGVDTGVAFSKLPFDHLLYTGSTRVGRMVMAAAAPNLTPVTLELGGKSPAIVHPSFDVAKAAELIVGGKLFNAGQTCVAPDYVLVPTARLDAFVQGLKDATARFFPRLIDNDDYTAIVNDRHRARLQAWLTDAVDKGATAIELNPAGETFDEAAGNKLCPTVLLDTTDDMIVRQEEIFGPILPVIGVRDTEEAVAFVNARPRPLALYYFDTNGGRQTDLLYRTHSGGAVMNDCLLHVAQDDLPFGGVGPSGMGAYHGREGFETFTHKKGVYFQTSINGTFLVRPPYKPSMMKTLLRVLIG